MKFVRAALALAGLLLPPVIATFLIHMLYEPRWVISAVIFLILLSLWVEAVRALRRMD